MFEEEEDDCTAAPGVMGQTLCHRYPWCGCDLVALYSALTKKWIAAGRPDDLGDRLDSVWRRMSDTQRDAANAAGRA